MTEQKKIDIKHNELTEWNWMVQYPENLKLGEFVDIGAFTYINAHYGIVIGDNVEIGSHCSIYSHNSIDKIYGKVVIGNNVKIGSHSTIMPDVEICDDAIIGAYSFVKKDITKAGVYIGIPVKQKD